MGLVLSPFFALGHLATLILKTLGLDVVPNGLTWPYELFYCLGSIGLGITGLIICYKGARLFFSQTASVLGVAGVWFASPLTFYLSIESSMSHGVSQFLISLFLYICIATPWIKQRRQQILLGLLLGLGALVRPQDVLFMSVPILMILATIITDWRKTDHPDTKPTLKPYQIAIAYGLPLVIIALVTGLMQIPQLLIYQWQFGSFFNIPYLQEGAAEGYHGSFHWGNPAILNVLFSGYHGLFSWHPLLFLAMIGLILARKRFPTLVWILFIAFALQVYLVAAWWCWWQGSSFGGRMFANCSFIFVWGLAALWDYVPSHRWKIVGIVATLFFMGWNALLVLQYESAMIPSEAPVTMGQIVQNQLFVIPYFINHLLKR
jgi:hypothetical protein